MIHNLKEKRDEKDLEEWGKMLYQQYNCINEYVNKFVLLKILRMLAFG